MPQYRENLAASHNNLGNLLLDLGRPAEAVAEYRQALAIRQLLVRDFPTMPQYHKEVAACHNNLGNPLRELGKRAEAAAECRQAGSTPWR